MKRNNNDAQTTIRLNKSLKNQIEESAISQNLSTMEWIRRACQEKLDAEKRARELRESSGSYLSQEDFNRMLKAALSNPDIRKIILTIIKN